MSERIAYVVGRYPAVSHTFIEREVDHLRRLGRSVDTFTIIRSSQESLLSEKDRQAYDTTTAVRPISAMRLLRMHLRALGKNPSGYLRTLKFALTRGGSSPKRLVWQLFYFVQAMVLWSECDKRGITHLHAHLANVAADVSRIAADFGSRGAGRWTWSFTMHGPTEFYDVERFGLRQKAADADFIICISDFCRSQLMSLVDSGHWSKMSVVHCGIDVEHFRPVDATPSDTYRILCVGRLVPEKGQLLLLDAVHAMVRRGDDVRVTYVGKGPDAERLASKAKELDIGQSVVLAGAVGQDHILDYYRDADVFVLASAAEGVPVVLMEAMAQQLPVVSTRIAGISELIEDGASGLLVRPGRSDLLVEAFDRLRSNPDATAQMARAGREQVAREFDITKCAAQVADVFDAQLQDAR